MSIKIGGIDVAQSALDSEWRILVLETIVEKLLNKMGGAYILTQKELEDIRSQSLEILKKKYPDAGIERK